MTGGLQRIPSTPLDYKYKHKAGPNELLVNYDGDGKINRLYITDKDINFIDITEQIIDLINNADAKNSTVNIENYGTVNLQDFVNLLYNKTNNSVQMIDLGMNIKYIEKENTIDNKSLSIKNKSVQIYGFDTAADNTSPVKIGNTIIWVGNSTNINNSGDNSSENPTDGNIYSCTTQNIVAGKVYLQASLRQKTIFPQRDFRVILPKTQDEFSQIQWNIKTNNTVPIITFSDNCLWKSIANSKLKENVNHIYKFVTYDHGTTWLASSEVYQFNNSDINNATEYYTVVVDK